jgi:hypothetical protein
MATATRVQAAILVSVREELAERIQCFLLVEKRTKPICGTSPKTRDGHRDCGKLSGSSLVRHPVLSLAFGKTSIYYHECMFNVSHL